MDQGPKSKSRRSRRQRSTNKKSKSIHFKMPDPPPQRDYEPCPICGNKIEDINLAIAHQESKQPCHFDCVLDRLLSDEQIEGNEALCYLGRGSFGIVVDRKVSSETPRYIVRKRIQFEEPERPIDWRKELSPGISKD